MKICATCGKKFKRQRQRTLRSWKRAKYCSPECAKAARRPKAIPCEKCGQMIVPYSQGKRGRMRFCSLRCANTNRPINPETTKYRRKNIRGRRVLEHRWVMECKLGRKLSTLEYVHHKNGNRLDNRLENLELTTSLAHTRAHLLKHSLTWVCEVCGKTFIPDKTKRGGRKRTCSQKCRYQLMWRTRWRRAS